VVLLALFSGILAATCYKQDEGRQSPGANRKTKTIDPVIADRLASMIIKHQM
jgi:hypothetical protein